MRITQLAAQLYTVRDHTKTASDLAATLRKVRAIGYPAVQLSGTAPAPPEDVAKMLADNGLTCCSTHESSQSLLDETKAIAQYLAKLGCTSTACSNPGRVRLDTRDDVKALAARLNAAGKVLRDVGITFSYHNHATEFRRFNGRLMLDILYQETDPRCLHAELDTYWVQYGGGDSEHWCRALKGRLLALHLKDYKMTPEHRPTFAEIGQGNLDWPGIIAAADDSGCQWYIVEQDHCDGDPFDSLRISFEYLRDNLCS